MTYPSRNSRISTGLGSSSSFTSSASASSSSMISLHRSMHSSQMYTPGPAMSFLTCFWLFPQKEHFSRSPPSPMRATQLLLYLGPRPARGGPPAAGMFPPCHLALSSDGTASGPPTARAGPGADHPEDESSWLGRPYLGLALQARQNLVDETVLFGLLGGEEFIPLDVEPDLLLGPAGVLGHDLLHGAPHPEDLPGLDLQVAGLPVAALGGGLVQQDAGVRQGQPLAGGTGGQQHRGRRGG